MDAISSCVEILEGAYSFVLISILDPESLYIVKNTGTMVIGVSQGLQSAEGESINSLESSPNKDVKSLDRHQFQIVASDTTVFQDYTPNYYSIGDKEILRISIKDKIEKHKLKVVTEEKV